MSNYGKSIYNYRNDYIVNEAYIGKTPILLQIEEKIGEFRDNLPGYNADINRNKTIIEINRLFEKQFKMDVFALMVDKSKSPNGYTYSLKSKFDIAEEYRSISELICGDKVNGYYFKPNNNICVVVHISYIIFEDRQFTNAEVLAIILHEIGHNFSASIFNKLYIGNRQSMLAYKDEQKKLIKRLALGLLLFGITLPDLIDAIKDYKDINLYNEKMRKKQKKTQKKKQNKIRGWLSGRKARNQDKEDFYDELENRLSGDEYINQYYRNLNRDPYFTKDQNKKSNDRIDEVMADKFAGIYGYGPDQATALLKLDEFVSDALRKIYDDNDKKAMEANLKYEAAFRKIHEYDCHPNSLQRAYEELKLLKREVNKDDLDPKMRDIILEQISQLESIIKDMYTVNDKLSKSQEANRLYNEYINNNIPDAVAEDLEDQIEDAFDKALEKSKKEVYKRYNKRK